MREEVREGGSEGGKTNGQDKKGKKERYEHFNV